jgi:tRNA A37 N6-isopentenylltransferase MiaA
VPTDPHAFLLCGPSLAGKSTASERIAATLGAEIISADAINAKRGLPFGAEGLPESVWAETLRRLNGATDLRYPGEDSAYEEPILRGLGLVQNDRGG